MFKIGDFSKLSRVAVKTLRYYDEIDLFRPRCVDRFTGYRYYSADQLSRLNRILALKDLGFSLEQVSRLLDEELLPAEMRGMLRMRRMELEQQVREDQARLARVEARLRQIEQEGTMPDYEVVLKKVGPQRVAGVRDVIPTYADIGRLFGEVEAYVARHGVRPVGACMAIYYDTEYRERDIDAEAATPVSAALAESERVKVHEMPGAEAMACVIHRGGYDSLDQAYNALLTWVEANGYRIAGPNREVYLRGHTDSGLDYPEAHVTDDPAEYVTELQFPVEKV